MTTFLTRITGTSAGRPPRTAGARPASRWAFAGVAVTSFGGPLALAALYAPGIVAVVAPLAADPAITRAPIPGMAVAERFAGHGFAVVVGAAALAATAVGLLLSASIGLFGYTESLAVPYAGMSLVVEFAGVAVLVTAAAVVLAARPANRRSLEQSF